MTTKGNFLALVSKEETSTLDNIKERIKNRETLKESQQFALNILERLHELKWTEKDLAAKMEISTEQVTKMLRGKENISHEMQIKIQKILNINA